MQYAFEVLFCSIFNTQNIGGEIKYIHQMLNTKKMPGLYFDICYFRFLVAIAALYLRMFVRWVVDWSVHMSVRQ